MKEEFHDWQTCMDGGDDLIGTIVLIVGRGCHKITSIIVDVIYPFVFVNQLHC